MLLPENSALLAELLENTNRQIQLIGKLLSVMRESEDRWVDTRIAERETGIPAERIRYLARSGQIQNKKIGQRKLSVKLSDLESFC
jgi:hypothetical protein